MAKIIIDARESGTSTGRYVDKLLENLHRLDSSHTFLVLTKQHRLDYLKHIAPSFEIIETKYKEFTFGEQLGFRRQIKSLKPDLVHFTMVQQPILYRGRAVTSMLDLTTLRFVNPSKNGLVFRFKQIVYKYVNLRVAKKTDAIIAISEFVKGDIQEFTGVSSDKISVTYNAADKITELPEPVPGVGKEFIMYVGRPLPHKNLVRLVEAFSVLQKDQPNLQLVLAGKKDAIFDQIQKSVTDRGIQNVIFTGFISEGQLRWLYENTSCYVFPSLSEGFGLPGLEAMVHGAPVASSNATCLPEIYGDAAAYFNPLDVSDISRVVGKIISDKSFANDLKKRGKAQAAKYSWERMARQTLEVYERVLKQK